MSVRITTCILLLAVMGLFAPLFGQETGNPYIHNYKPQEYQASSANYVSVQDQRGVMYFGNFRGVLEYDGVNWRLLNLPNNSAVRSLAVDSAGTVYVGAPGELGYLQADSQGRMQYQSLVTHLSGNYQDMVQIVGLEYGAWFRTFAKGEMYFASPDTFYIRQVPETRERSGFFRFGENMLTVSTQGLVRWTQAGFQPVAGGEGLAGKTLLSLVQVGDSEALIHLQKEGLWRLRFQNNRVQVSRFPMEIAETLEDALISNLLYLKEKLIVSTVKEGLFVLDMNGRLLQHIDEESGLQDNLVMNTFLDQHHSLWLCLSRGISRLEIDDPIHHWDEALGLEGIVFATHRHEGVLYATTTLGVYYLRKNRFFPVEGIGAESWSFFPVSDRRGQSRLFVSTVRGLYEIDNKRGKPVDLKNPVANLFPSRVNPNLIYSLSIKGGLKQLVWQEDRWSLSPGWEKLTDRYRLIEEDKEGNLWVSPAFEEKMLLRLRLQADSVQIDTFLHQTEVQAVFALEEELIYTTPVGLFRFDSQTEDFVPDTLLPFREVGILSMTPDQQGNLWIACYQGARRWLEVAWKRERGYERDSLLLKGLDNVEVWGSLHPENNEQVWISSSEGLYRYTLTSTLYLPDMPAPIIRKVETNGDSLLPFQGLVAQGKLLKLSPEYNSLRFDLVSPFFIGRNEIRYRYRLSNWDPNWSPWTASHQKEFTLLPAGRYVFEVQSRNRYGAESEITRLEFDIRPPWYRTIWAFVSYGLLAIFMVYGTVRFNTQRLHYQNENLEKLIYERTAEIWEQHKLIVKKTVALKRQKAEVAAQHKLLETKNIELETALTQLKSAQSHLVESEKMASLGQLTAGIAHEINNPINYVRNSVSPLKKDFSEIRLLYHKIRELRHSQNLPQTIEDILAYAKEIDAEYLFEEMGLLVEGIEEGATRTANIVKGLKTFARTDQDAFRHVNLHESIDATLTILANRLKNRILVTKEYDPQLPVCECMPGKINQVFMNLINNSIYAIEQNPQTFAGEEPYIGKLLIKTENIRGKSVRITLSDTGIGMDAQTKQKIFDPFFTTKPVGEGTGLGLSITFGIVEKHQGRITVKSTPQKGSTFVLLIPLQQTPVEEIS